MVQRAPTTLGPEWPLTAYALPSGVQPRALHRGAAPGVGEHPPAPGGGERVALQGGGSFGR